MNIPLCWKLLLFFGLSYSRTGHHHFYYTEPQHEEAAFSGTFSTFFVGWLVYFMQVSLKYFTDEIYRTYQYC